MSIEFWKRTAEFWQEDARASGENAKFWREMYTTMEDLHAMAKEHRDQVIARRDETIKELRTRAVDVANANAALDIENQNLRKQLCDLRAELGMLRRLQRRRPF